MDKAMNFWELREELEQLGFNIREVINPIRQAIYNGSQMGMAAYQDGEIKVVLDLGQDDAGRLNLFGYSLNSNGQHDESQSQAFKSEVPLKEAKQLVESRILHRQTEPPDAYMPLFLTDVRRAQTTLNNNTMNTQNLEFLRKTLLNLGFGEKLNADMEKQISSKAAEFKLNTGHEFNGKQVDYTLHFKAGDNHDMYFFNKFDAKLKTGNDEQVNQSFYINKGSGITAKEAFNLMEGRAVHKQLFSQEGEKYTAWLKLDKDNLTEGGNMKFRSWNENYGYMPENVLAGKGIKEMNTDEGRDNLLRSLRKGNAQQITVERNGEEKKYYVTANPQFKTVDLYDPQMQKIKRKELLKPGDNTAQSQKKASQQKEELPEKKQRSKKAKVA